MYRVMHFTKDERKKAAALSGEVFDKKYFITEENLDRILFDAEDFCEEASFCIVETDSARMLGFIGIKLSKNQKLYPNTAWISILAVAADEQKKGYGRLLVETAMEQLALLGVDKISVGEDFLNFFSGIPEPDERKIAFFRSLGFWVSDSDHYDLEADIVNNRKIDAFCTAEFEKKYVVTTYCGEAEEFFRFLKAEFPGRWEYEAECALQSGKDASEIVLLWEHGKTELLGYCMLSKYPDGRGGLGPIGIAGKIRGNGIGDYLLRESLVQLKRIGAKRVNVNWTILKDFYGKFDILPERTYRSAGWKKNGE